MSNLKETKNLSENERRVGDGYNKTLAKKIFVLTRIVKRGILRSHQRVTEIIC